jgi:hypothetical protein
VQGDQYVAPSIPETVPDTIKCARLGQPFPRSGSYDLRLTDDTAKADRSLNRMQGTFSWKNAFWMFSRNTLDVKFCAGRAIEAAPDVRMKCSRQIEWQR